MHIYLAGRYRDQAFLRQVRRSLNEMGHKVTSRWLDAVEPEDRPDDPDWANGYAVECAFRDMSDIEASDAFVLFAGGGGSTRGGMYVEFGFAYAKPGVLYPVVVGPRSNVFTYLPDVKHFDSWDAFFDWAEGNAQ